ncbi:MAG: hypothetical protein JO368_00855, partial [Acidimicrobiales bacterium]|nr:hypothetical protein [Acidimicrobiales bacterium]
MGRSGSTSNPGPPAEHEVSERGRRWAATMAGRQQGGITVAHADSRASIAVPSPASQGLDRRAREEQEDGWLAEGATRASGSGHRRRPETADPWRTCFERDR